MTAGLRACLLGALLLLSFCGIPLLAADDAPPRPLEWLQLCDGQVLAGWTQSAVGSDAWQARDGLLHGTDKSGLLSVEHTFGAALWKFHWKNSAGGLLELDLPEVPGVSSSPPVDITIRLLNGARCGEILSGAKSLSPGTTVPDTKDKGHEVEVLHHEAAIVVTIDGKEAARAAIPPGRRTGFGLRVAQGSATIGPVLFREPGGVALFNGHDLTGFYCDGNLKSWGVENGSLVNLAKHGSFLRSEKEYGNFTLSLLYRIVKGGNSGVGIRTPVRKWPSSDGMEIQVLDEPDGKRISHETVAGIYRNMPAFRRADKHFPEWNHLVIKADGPMISVWMNGVLVNHANLSRHSTLRYRDLQGWIGFQDHNNRVEYRDVTILEAPPGTGFPAWQQPASPPPGQLVLGPVLDSSELLAPHPVETAVVAGASTGNSDRGGVLANLKGPGAVTRIFRSNASGTLALYFDGEKKPRVQSSWASLAKHLPIVSASESTIYTYIPYQKSLRIEQQGARPASYQFTYATYPSDNVPPSGTGPLPGADRGWMFALHYAQFHHNHGVVPFEPHLLPVSAGPKSLAPKASAVVAESAGAGQTRWLKLTGPASLLANQSLWLDIYVDGESSPAVSAPARLLFPTFAPEAGNNPAGSFMLARKGQQMYNLLAIPFGNGLKIMARNTGDQPIDNFAVEAGVHPLTADEVPPLRLRGQFASTSAGDWLDLQGEGKLVWLAIDQAPANLGEISAVTIDGQAQPGWQKLRVADWLGRDTPGSHQNSGLDGTAGPLAWRHLLIDPLCFRSSLKISLSHALPGGTGTLALAYVKK